MVWGSGSGALGLRAFGFGVQGFWGFGARVFGVGGPRVSMR